METSLANPERMKGGPAKEKWHIPFRFDRPTNWPLFRATHHTTPVRVNFTSFLSSAVETTIIRATHHTTPVRASLMSFLSLQAHPWAGFTHLSSGPHIFIHLLHPTPTYRSTSWHHALQPEDEGSRVLWNVGILLQRYTASQLRRFLLGMSNVIRVQYLEIVRDHFLPCLSQFIIHNHYAIYCSR